MSDWQNELYKQKYLKYKAKYLELKKLEKNQSGGFNRFSTGVMYFFLLDNKLAGEIADKFSKINSTVTAGDIQKILDKKAYVIKEGTKLLELVCDSCSLLSGNIIDEKPKQIHLDQNIDENFYKNYRTVLNKMKDILPKHFSPVHFMMIKLNLVDSYRNQIIKSEIIPPM